MRLPSKLRLFFHATSLGGVESLVEWRAMSDEGVDPRLLRVSVGLEAWEDLRDDLLRAFGELWEESEGEKNVEAEKVGETNGGKKEDDDDGSEKQNDATVLIANSDSSATVSAVVDPGAS